MRKKRGDVGKKQKFCRFLKKEWLRIESRGSFLVHLRTDHRASSHPTGWNSSQSTPNVELEMRSRRALLEEWSGGEMQCCNVVSLGLCGSEESRILGLVPPALSSPRRMGLRSCGALAKAQGSAAETLASPTPAAAWAHRTPCLLMLYFKIKRLFSKHKLCKYLSLSFFFFRKDTDIPLFMFFHCKMNIPMGFTMLRRAGDGTCTGHSPARAQHWAKQQHCRPPALGVPQDSKQGTATLFSSQRFCLQAGGTLWSAGYGKSCCIQMRLESACFGGGPDKACGGFEGERQGPREPPVFEIRDNPQQTTAWARSS